MKSDYIQYLKNLLLYSAIIAILSFVLAFFLPDTLVTPGMPFLLVFCGLSLLTHYFVFKKNG